MIEVRRHLHQHPCLSDDEAETANYISKQLSFLGINHHITKECNVVGKIEGVGDKKIALRADMDALPILEETNLPFSSIYTGVMHACGHDFHVANLLGIAKILSEPMYLIDGTVYLCFQVGEEKSKGAKDMLDYLDVEGGVDSCLGIHVDPNLSTGTIQSKSGSLMAGSSLFSVVVKGKGGHGSTPWLSLDPIKPASEMVLRLASISSTHFSAFDSVVVNPCAINAGSAGNIIPEVATIEGNIRYFKSEQLEEIIGTMTSVIEGIAASYGVYAELKLSETRTPPMVGDSSSYMRLEKVSKESEYTFSEMITPWMASDNFSTYLAKYGGIYCFGGVTKENSISYPIHTSQFNPDEEALKVFCEVFLRYIDEFFVY